MTRTLTSYETVDPEEAQRIKKERRSFNVDPTWFGIVMEGRMLHVPISQKAMGARYSIAQARGKRLRTRKDGEGWVYVWTEEIE